MRLGLKKKKLFFYKVKKHAMTGEANYLKELVHTKARISLRSDGIGSVVFRQHSEILVKDQEEMNELIQELTRGRKTPFLYQAEESVSISKEAREYGRRLSGLNPVSAAGVLARSLPYKLIADFYYKFYKPAIPYKVFSNEKEAVEWLKQFVIAEDK